MPRIVIHDSRSRRRTGTAHTVMTTGTSLDADPAKGEVDPFQDKFDSWVWGNS